jgi:hypothetical protein
MRNPDRNYQRQRNKGRIYSALLHLLILLLALFGLPSMFDRHPPDEDSAISIEVLPISAVSNVKPSDQPLAEKPKEAPKPPEKPPEPKAPEKPVEQKNTKETPPVKTAQAEPPPPPPPPAPVPEKKVEPKPKPEEQKPPEKPKPKPKPVVDPLDAILKSVSQQAKSQPKTPDKAPEKTRPQTDSGSPSRSTHYNDALPMSISEKDAIRSQIAHCWSVPAGVKNAQNLVVTLRMQVAQDGTITRVELSGDKGRADTDPAFRAAAESARRAVQQCSPLKNLSPEKYETWRDMELTFDPKDMLQ